MSLRVHHLNCGTLCPYGKRWINGKGGWLAPAELCCHCLLIETADGLVLVDTGFGSQDLRNPGQLGAAFRLVTRPRLRIEDTALEQLRAVGFQASDVRHIVVTHLDLDHAGGLSDFPQAKVHVFAPEKAAIDHPRGSERNRYRSAHFAHGPQWVVHQTAGERWMGFESIRAMPGGGDEILLIPLTGHTRGHCGVAVRSGEGWLLHCGDAYFFHGEVTAQDPHCPPGLRAFQTLVQIDGATRRRNQTRLRELVRGHGDAVTLFCAHDPVELARHRGR